MQIQELTIKAPTMMNERFHVQKESKEYQTWTRSFIDGDRMEFWYEAEQIWLVGVVDKYYIDDGSGNAPGADAHFFIELRHEGKHYKYDLHEGLKIRLEAPTDEELRARVGWCEGTDWGEYPDEHRDCLEHGTRYVTEHGQAVWYCDNHKPSWLKLVAA